MEEFYLWFILLFFSYFLILFGFMHFSHKPDVLNNFFAFFALSFVFIHVLLFVNIMSLDPKAQERFLGIWMLTLGIPIIVLGLIISFSTICIYTYRLIFKPEKKISKFEERTLKKLENMSKLKRDVYRKISHVLIFIGLFVIWNIGYMFVMESTKEWVGMVPDENNTLLIYIQMLTAPHDMIMLTLNSLGWFYFLIFFFFYAVTILLLANELTRKTRYLSFPFNRAIVIMTEEERESYGTYLYFAIGQLFAAFLCPPMVYFAILGMSGIGDLMTSQIGIRYGKHHIKWNEKKTWEGNIAGTITSFIICFFFMGAIWAVIFSIAFMMFDLFTNKPINLSDNLLIPIGSAIIYVLLRFFLDFNYVSIVLQGFS